MPPARRKGLRVVSRAGTRTLYLRGTVRGQRVFESAGTDDPDLAEEARAAREAELFRGAVHGVKPRVTFAAAVLSYLQAEPRPAAMKLALGKLVRLWGATVTCDDIDQAKLDRAGRALCRATSTPATRQRQVATPTKAVLSHAARRGWCQLPAFERTKGGKARTDWLTPREAEALLANANRLVRPLLTFLFCTGARVGEAIALTWNDVDLQHARAVLRQTKNGNDRILQLCPRAIVTLANLPDREGPVFRHRRSAAYRLTNKSRTTPFGGQVRRAWATACSKAGIKPGITPHHARHTWASWDYAVHRDLLGLKARGDWSSVTLVERYAHLVPEGLAPQIVAFWGGVSRAVVEQDAHRPATIAS